MENQDKYLDTLKKRNYEMYKYFMRGLELISALKSKMYEAYIVGGAVRDYLLNIDFKDIDIATNATPEEVLDIFKDLDIDDRYASLGSVVIRENGFYYEITTFRNEEYVKYKIKDVHYSKKLVEDIIRRDYTINALALTPNLTIIDLVEGQKDLEKGIVRVIGSGKRRFQDDPSRILRGLRLVSKYNFSVETNTEKAMRKCRNCLKEISETKLTSELENIINEKYGLKALKIIDDNNLFRSMPKYAYWISLIIKYYKKLSFIEKYTLLYLITGELPKNIEANRANAQEVKKLYDVAQNLFVNKVDSMMIFNEGQDMLLAADRVCKAYNSRYHRQKGKIKKLNRKMKIRSISDLKFTARELTLMMREDQLPMTNQIMNELIYNVVEGKLVNRNDVLVETVRRMLEQNNYTLTPKENIVKEKTNFLHPKKDDRYFDDQHEETKLYEKIYDDYVPTDNSNYDSFDDIPVDMAYYEQMANSIDGSEQSNSYTAQKPNVTDARINALKNEYDEDFLNIYKIYIKGIKGYYDMTPGEQKIKIEEAKMQAKDFLIRNNPKYRILLERGII